MANEERVQRVLNHLPSWWSKEKDSQTDHIVRAYSEELDLYYTEINNLHTEIFITHASGKYLDDIGKLFKLSRKGGETDDAFRIRILAFFPGYSGGGTIPAIKNTISQITGIPITDVEVIEDVPPGMTFTVEVVLDDIGEDALIPTIKEVVWDAKSAGVYPFFIWSLEGDLLSDEFSVSDSVDIQYISVFPWFIYEVSLIDGMRLLW
jgi:hypothetical protein